LNFLEQVFRLIPARDGVMAVKTGGPTPATKNPGCRVEPPDE
jgi:hypothetical protein